MLKGTADALPLNIELLPTYCTFVVVFNMHLRNCMQITENNFSTFKNFSMFEVGIIHYPTSVT